jgi:hypothetical protein
MKNTLLIVTVVSFATLLSPLEFEASHAAAEVTMRAAVCSGLHAGIRAQLVPQAPPNANPEHVLLLFTLLNDADIPADTQTGPWKIVIDGRDLPDSDFILGNGPRPSGGFGVLKPGDSYEFGTQLPVAKYFPEKREYRVAWRAGNVSSSTLVVNLDTLIRHPAP